MLDDEDYVIIYKYHLETTFNNMIDWFLKEKLEINTRPLPAYAPNNHRKVCLLDLYMAVKREGGHRRITENNMWAMIVRDIGFEYDEGEYMRLIYTMYLDVLIYYYKYKSTQDTLCIWTCSSIITSISQLKKRCSRRRKSRWWLIRDKAGVKETGWLELMQIKRKAIQGVQKLLEKMQSITHFSPATTGRESKG
ncbi:putative transcription factor & chromatin remodeling ARID family [Helianthus annuus]|nr:putative transcription factor & chromatin remodeling ARID family [Helianthus annuus]